MSFSRIFCQMIRVISSPSISTTGFFTLILATGFLSALGQLNEIGVVQGACGVRRLPRRAPSLI